MSRVRRPGRAICGRGGTAASAGLALALVAVAGGLLVAGAAADPGAPRAAAVGPSHASPATAAGPVDEGTRGAHGAPAAFPPDAYLDGPPAGHTGGFDEPTCRACHFDRDLNPEPGDVTIEGVPDRYEPDSTYAVTIVLSQPEMRRAGFQAAARRRTGARRGCSAGKLEPGEEGVRAGVAKDVAPVRDSASSRSSGDGVQGGAGPHGGRAGASDRAAGAGGCEVVYLQHTEEGTGPVEGESVRWRARWTAPERDAGPVAFHVAANAANDDASEFGDRIYAAEAVSRPAP